MLETGFCGRESNSDIWLIGQNDIDSVKQI